MTKAPLAQRVCMRAERIFDEDFVDRILWSFNPELGGRRTFDLLSEGDDGAKKVNEWLHQYERVETPINSYHVGQLETANRDVCDLGALFAAVRSVTVLKNDWPIEVALLGQKHEGGSYFWGSRIFPDSDWPSQILDASPIDLSDAPAAADVARECVARITRAQSCRLYSEEVEHTKQLMERLLHLGKLEPVPKVEVERPDLKMGEDQEADERVHNYLDLSFVLEDPRLEVFILQRAWWCRDMYS